MKDHKGPLALSATIVFLGSMAQAATLTSTSNVNITGPSPGTVNCGDAHVGNGAFVQSDCGGARQFIVNPTTLGGTATANWDGLATAQASFGSLHSLVSSSISGTNAFYGGKIDAISVSGFSDKLTINDPTLNFFDPIKLSVTFTLTGTAPPESLSSDVHHSSDYQQTLALPFGTSFTNLSAGNYISAVTTVHNGVAFDFAASLTMFADIYVESPTFHDCGACPYSGSIQWDFAHTATLSGITATNPNNGNAALSGYTITSQSGTDYQSLLAAPEPSTWCLALVGSCLLACRRLFMPRASL